MEEQKIPYSIEAEQSVLGSVFLDKELLLTIVESLAKDDFYSEQNAEIFSAMEYLFKNSQPFDMVTITNVLKDRDVFEQSGGITYLTKLATVPDFKENINAYIDIVKEKSIRRKLINAAHKTVQFCNNQELSITELLDKSEKMVFDIAQEQQSQSVSHIKDVLLDNFQTLQQLYSRKSKITGLTTGFIDLDRKLGGLQKTDLVLIAARPAMGKTAFGLNIAQNAALRGNAKVAVFSLEMSKEQLTQRMIAAASRVELNKLRNGNLDDDEWHKTMIGFNTLQHANIYIDDSPGITSVEIRSKCRKMKIDGGLDLVIIDYLQLMESDSRTENRQQEISKISRSLKILAKELQCPVVALSQLSRAPESRSDHRPMLSDLRESGAIEQDADLVMFLYRDDYYNKNSEQKNITEIIVAKHRHGEIGTVPLTWQGHYQLFSDNADNRFENF